jgi:hypothetical protein
MNNWIDIPRQDTAAWEKVFRDSHTRKDERRARTNAQREFCASICDHEGDPR